MKTKKKSLFSLPSTKSSSAPKSMSVNGHLTQVRDVYYGKKCGAKRSRPAEFVLQNLSLAYRMSEP